MSRPRSDLPGVTESGPLTYEPSQRWVRGFVGETVVVDSKAPLLLWEEGNVLPLYLFPEDHVDRTVVKPSRNPPSEEAHHGLVSYFDLEVDGDKHQNAIWRYDVVDLDTFLAVDWSAADKWMEEEVEVLGHPRDPYHRVDNRQSSRHVRVAVEGQVLADAKTPTLVFETSLPTRFYFPREEVSMEHFESSSTRTQCAYKGEASYWSVRVGDEVIEDLAWTYEDPFPDNSELTGLVSFFNERVDLDVDGERLDRPRTLWSRGLRANVKGGSSAPG